MGQKEKFEKWKTMEFSEKQKFNGFKGFVDNEKFSEGNAFMREEKERMKRRVIKAKYDRENLERKKNE